MFKTVAVASCSRLLAVEDLSASLRLRIYFIMHLRNGVIMALRNCDVYLWYRVVGAGVFAAEESCTATYLASSPIVSISRLLSHFLPFTVR